MRSFKRHCIPAFPLNHFLTPKVPAQARIVAFHGRPDPDEALRGYGEPSRTTGVCQRRGLQIIVIGETPGSAGGLAEFDSSGNNSICAGRAEVECSRQVLPRGDWGRAAAAQLMEAPCWPLARAQAIGPRWLSGTGGEHAEREAVA